MLVGFRTDGNCEYDSIYSRQGIDLVNIVSSMGSIVILVDTRTLRAERKSEERMVPKEEMTTYNV